MIVFSKCMFELWSQMLESLVCQPKNVYAQVVQVNTEWIIIGWKMG